MMLINGEYFADAVSEDDIRWAMHLSILALQGAANVQDWESYTTKVA